MWSVCHATSIEIQDYGEVRGCAIIVVPWYGTCFMSSFRHLEFGGGFYIFGKFVDPCYFVLSSWDKVAVRSLCCCSRLQQRRIILRIVVVTCVSNRTQYKHTSQNIQYWLCWLFQLNILSVEYFGHQVWTWFLSVGSVVPSLTSLNPLETDIQNITVAVTASDLPHISQNLLHCSAVWNAFRCGCNSNL
jgi:hypothetical protein